MSGPAFATLFFGVCTLAAIDTVLHTLEATPGWLHAAWIGGLLAATLVSAATWAGRALT